MKDHPGSDSPPDPVQAKALASAILLRNCSLRDGVSTLVRQAYRIQMRTQAIKWRRTPGNTTACRG